jgi:murein DD-endopeptidase MepM/ murein hydrolase activator NlpD
MVNLSLDAPPTLRSSSHRGQPAAIRLTWAALLALLTAAGGFYAGRKTAATSIVLPNALSAALPARAPEQPGGATGSAAVAQVEGTQTAGPLPAPVVQPFGTAQPLGGSPSAGPATPAAPGVHRLAVKLRGPLEESVADALPPAERASAGELTQLVNRLLVWNIQVAREGRPGDQLDLVYESAAPGQGDMAVIDAVRYTSQKMGRTFAAYRYKAPSSAFARYYQADGSELEERLVDAPVREYEQVTSLLRDGRHHKGVDFKTPVGTPVYAPFAGEVVRRTWHFAANGNCLEIADPASGRHALFLHLESVSNAMQPGRKIQKGEQLALSGNSGHSTAPHLHYQLESASGSILDPFAVQATRRAALEAGDRPAFEVEKKRLEALFGPAGALNPATAAVRGVIKGRTRHRRAF